MGGNALKEHGAQRVPALVANGCAQRFIWIMGLIAAKYGAEYRMELVRSYRTKPNFGDLDFVLDSRFYDKVSREQILAELEQVFGGQPIASYRGGDVFGIGYPLVDGGCLQIDIIKASPDIYQASLDYFAWNDLGNLVGRIAHKLGFKYGHDGLSVVLRDGTHQFGMLPVSTELDEIYTFLGFDPERYHQGFDTVEDIYRYVTTSKYFNPEIYSLDNRNHTARVRDRKRPIYTGFLQWLEMHREEVVYHQFPEDKRENLPLLFKAFPHVETQYNAMWDVLEQQRRNKARFNATLVSELTGREGAELGLFMKEFKQARQAWIAALDEASDETIRVEILRFHELLKNKQRPIPKSV